MARSIAVAAVLLLGMSGMGAAHAQTAPQRPEGRGANRQMLVQQLTPEQQLKLFPGRKALLLEEQNERIAILQRSQGCVGRARTPEALRSCLMQERRDYQSLRQRIRGQMRELFARNGVPYPQLETMPQRRSQPAGKGALESI